jgi:TfoX/Sxy family transcriptional regulator of competence genes
MPWKKVPPENAARLIALMATYPDATPRKMFGCQVFFIAGNMCIGAFEDGYILRLSEADQDELLENPMVTHFAPMDRPMREYLLVTPEFHSDDALFQSWISRSVEYTRSLPPPVKKIKN